MPSNKLFSALSICACLLTAGCSDSTALPVRTYPLGERVELGHLIYTAFETQWMTQLGEGVNARVPQHRFFLVRLTITNSGASDLMTPMLTLVDDKGRTYSELKNGEGVPQWIGFIRQVRPAESAQGNAVFDVAPGHYKLQVADENEQRLGLIDIPLSFGAETPEIPPAAAEKN